MGGNAKGNNVMRLIRLGCIFLLGLTMLLSGCGKKTPDHITITLDGKKFEEPGAIKHSNGQLMVPVSFIRTAFGKEVDWTDRQKRKNTSNPQRYYSDRVAVLMYHELMEVPDKEGVLEVDHFRKQMALLKSEGFNVISMDQYLDFVLKGKPVPDNAVLITFDDGYENFYTYAFPILKEYGFTATNFVIVSTIDEHKESGRAKLTWDQMREMKKEGMDFYSHTYDMHKYGLVDEKGRKKPVTTRQLYLEQEQRVEDMKEYELRIRTDLTRAEQRLREELGNTQSVIAFPYGAFHDELLSIIHSLGIEVSFVVKDGVNTKEERNGYRVNGGRPDLTPEQIISHIKEVALQKMVPLEGDDAELMIDGEAVPFTLLLGGETAEETFVPLREFCDKYNIRVEWSPKKMRATLTTKRG